LLNITYQAAKNYLNGRLPNAEILIRLAEVREYSLHWLLTGAGEKFVRVKATTGTPPAPDQMRDFVREVCAEMLDERLGKAELYPKVVEMPSDSVFAETARGATAVEK
jgi:hypothetical protein